MVDTAQALAITFAILQAVAFTLFGLATVIFGPKNESTVIVVQAILVAGYNHLVQMIVLAEPRDLFNVLGAWIVFFCWVVLLCVLTCPPVREAVSNTKANHSPLDVPPPSRNLTTRIKAKLKITHR